MTRLRFKFKAILQYTIHAQRIPRLGPSNTTLESRNELWTIGKHACAFAM